MRAELAIGLFIASCGPGSSGGKDLSKATLTVDPPTSTLMILNGAAASEDFTATLKFPDGSTQDVTATTTFAIDSEFGLFNSNTLQMSVAGKTQVFATYTDKMGTADVIAMLKDIRIDPTVPPGAPGWFGNPEDPSHAPTVVYPAPDVIIPRNLGDFEVHWIDASTNNVFEISLTTNFADVRAYVPGGNGAGGGPDPSYMAFLASEWTAAVGNETSVTLQVRGVQSSNPTTVGSAPPQTVKLSNEAMLGGLYYWASSSSDPNEPYGIYRHDMSKPGQPAMQFMTTAQTGNRCVACHVLSRDGKEMLVTYDGGNNPATTVDVGTSTAKPVVTGATCTSYTTCGGGANCIIPTGQSSGTCQTAWNFATFTPDGSQFLSVWNGTLVVRDYASQAILATMPAAGTVSHPDLSPDGTKLVYVHPGVVGSDWAFGTGSIFIRNYDQSTKTFGPELMLVGDGAANYYYPSFSPDGQWVLYNKGDNSQANGVSGSYNGPNATLWVVKADGTGAPVQLAAANVSTGLTDSWGRWAPFAQTFGANDEPMYWVTVSSKRDFGVRLVGLGRPQVWMTPFFPDKAAANQDPSAVAFRLPFQDITTNNHIAQWTEQVVITQ